MNKFHENNICFIWRMSKILTCDQNKQEGLFSKNKYEIKLHFLFLLKTFFNWYNQGPVVDAAFSRCTDYSLQLST
jgi:hypothetical protein